MYTHTFTITCIHVSTIHSIFITHTHTHTHTPHRRGLIMGLWSTNVFVGGILGALIPAVWATPTGPWGWSFLTPALILLAVALAACLLLIPGWVLPLWLPWQCAIMLYFPDPRLIGMQSALVSVPAGHIDHYKVDEYQWD